MPRRRSPSPSSLSDHDDGAKSDSRSAQRRPRYEERDSRRSASGRNRSMQPRAETVASERSRRPPTDFDQDDNTPRRGQLAVSDRARDDDRRGTSNDHGSRRAAFPLDPGRGDAYVAEADVPRSRRDDRIERYTYENQRRRYSVSPGHRRETRRELYRTYGAREDSENEADHMRVRRHRGPEDEQKDEDEQEHEDPGQHPRDARPTPDHNAEEVDVAIGAHDRARILNSLPRVVIRENFKYGPDRDYRRQRREAPRELVVRTKGLALAHASAPKSKSASSGTSSSSSAKTRKPSIAREVGEEVIVETEQPPSPSRSAGRSSASRRAPSERAQSVRAPSVRALSVRAPSVRAPSERPCSPDDDRDRRPIYRRPIIQEYHNYIYDHGTKRAASLASACAPSPTRKQLPAPSVAAKHEHDDYTMDIHRRIREGSNEVEEDIHIELKSDDGQDCGCHDHGNDKKQGKNDPCSCIHDYGEEEAKSVRRSAKGSDRPAGSTRSHKSSSKKADEAKPPREFWTEVRKDLVGRRAIEAKGYSWCMDENDDGKIYIEAKLGYDEVKDLVASTYKMRRRVDKLTSAVPRGVPARIKESYCERDITFFDPQRERRRSEKSRA